MEKFTVGESVVVKHDDGGTSSGKVSREVEEDTYLVFYIGNGGWKSGRFHSSQLTSFGTALFLVTEAYEAHESELAEVTD